MLLISFLPKELSSLLPFEHTAKKRANGTKGRKQLVEMVMLTHSAFTVAFDNSLTNEELGQQGC